MPGIGEIFLANLFLSDQYLSTGSVPLILTVITLIIHVAFAIGVYNDAAAHRSAEQHVWFVSPIFWAGATLITGVFGAAIYWVMHYSSLTTDEKPPEQLASGMLPIDPDPRSKRDR